MSRSETVKPQTPKSRATNRLLAVAIVTLTLTTGSWAASKETVLYDFQGGSDGDLPLAGVIFDAQGNLYGTTYLGGDSGFGGVFKLARNQHGGWTKTELYSFQGNFIDGQGPMGSLVFDKQGNLYGTTVTGGVGDAGDGTVYKLEPT